MGAWHSINDSLNCILERFPIWGIGWNTQSTRCEKLGYCDCFYYSLVSMADDPLSIISIEGREKGFRHQTSGTRYFDSSMLHCRLIKKSGEIVL